MRKGCKSNLSFNFKELKNHAASVKHTIYFMKSSSFCKVWSNLLRCRNIHKRMISAQIPWRKVQIHQHHLCPSKQTGRQGQTRFRLKLSGDFRLSKVATIEMWPLERLPKAGPKFQDLGPNIMCTTMCIMQPCGTNTACSVVKLNQNAFLTICNLRLSSLNLGLWLTATVCLFGCRMNCSRPVVHEPISEQSAKIPW